MFGQCSRNWKRGALRLWAVISALWCWVAFSFGFWQYQQVSQGHQFSLAPPCSNSVPTCDPWERQWDETHPQKLGKDAVVTPQGLIFDPNITEEALRTLIGGATLWAFVPPLLVLAFGAALSWAISGFRRVSP